ncbi:MAG: PHB depolymerase family esterase [Pseudomonadota bacterium]
MAVRICKFQVLVITLIVSMFVLTSKAMAGSWQTNVSTGGFSRVHIYTPDTESSIGQGRALLLVLHGCTQSIDAYLNANLEIAAETYGMVVAVPDAENKAGFGCWSYWQGAKSRNAADYRNLISLASTLTDEPQYNIDADQVYISGLSSGATFANTTACLAPDVFAGMGISAGPSIGTSANGAIGACEAANVTLRCEQYAGSFSGFLDTQIASIAFGDVDTTVDQCYNRQNAEGMAGVYSVDELPGTNVVTESGRTADEIFWQENRVSMLFFNGVDHAWSGGVGASGSFVNGNGINYATYLGQYFLDNNIRVDRNAAPELSNVAVQVSNDTLVITGDVSDPDSQVQDVNVTLVDFDGNTTQLSTQNVASGSFNITSASLPDSLYSINVNATDTAGAISDTVSLSARIGPPPPDEAPILSNVIVITVAQCATVTGNVVDANQDLQRVDVDFTNSTQSAVISDDSFSAEACNLPGGEQNATVVAIDNASLSSALTLTFEINAAVTANLDEHIAANRLDFTNYANCYLEYGGAAFALNEIELSSDQCQWQDDDASCAGPQQICSNAGGGGDDDGSGDGGDGGSDECVDFSGVNYFHKLAGRAYSTGSFFAPDYFAQGSNEPLSGSTWGTSDLFSTDGETWQVGLCP